jgi:YD repeat-containing protein
MRFVQRRANRQPSLVTRHLLGAATGICLAVSAMPSVVRAAESVTYTYDALGRLVTTMRSGGPASGVNAATDYDPAGNRKTVTVSGASTSSPPMKVIVVPLNGYTIIPLGN